MLWTIFAILVVLWILGLATTATIGGFLQLILLFAIIAAAVSLIRGDNPL